MHSGIVKRNRFPGRRPLQILRWLRAAQTVCCVYDLDISSRISQKQFHCTVAHGPKLALRGVTSHLVTD
eukprot:COSAG01_NODE_62748_length_283_cov_0.717391_1_plen_68_part_01